VQLFTRVIVPFGKGKFYTGIITKIHQNVPTLYQAKYIEHVLDDAPLIGLKHYQFWNWIAQYYMAPIGDVMNAALPANFKLASETKVVLHPDFDEQNTPLDDREFLIIEALSMQETLDLKEISEIAGIKTIQPIIKRLIEKRAVLTQEELNNKFTAKTALFVVLQETYRNDQALNDVFEKLQGKKSSGKQEAVLLHLLKLGGFIAGEVTPILRKALEEEGCSLSAMNTLEKNGVIRFERLEISRIQSAQMLTDSFPILSKGQEIAYQSIQEQLTTKDTVLLHGITGSGKTELYIHLIENALKNGKQILFLIPEIALTTQLIQRLTVYFGKQIGVYHSRFNANERVEIWNKVLANDPNEFRIVVGARSAVFLPFQDLGLVIVDEEHESSYKQHDPSPRYNARDIGIVLAHYFKAKTVLGSATPSIESVSYTHLRAHETN
jgi:primosomal protein N' (replication factor Y)